MKVRGTNPSDTAFLIAASGCAQTIDQRRDLAFHRGVEPQRDECAYALGQRGEAGDARGMHRYKAIARRVRARAGPSPPGLMREPMLDQHQAVVAEEHLAVDEHRGRTETAARDQLLGA